MPLLPKLFSKFRSDDSTSSHADDAPQPRAARSRGSRPDSTYSVNSTVSTTSRPGRFISDDFGKKYSNPMEKHTRRNSKYHAEESVSGAISPSSMQSRTPTPAAFSSPSPTPAFYIDRRPSKLSEKSTYEELETQTDQFTATVRRRHSIDSVSSHTKPRSLLSVESDLLGTSPHQTSTGIPLHESASTPSEISKTPDTAGYFSVRDAEVTALSESPPSMSLTRRYKSMRVPSPSHKEHSELAPLPDTHKNSARPQANFNQNHQSPDALSSPPQPFGSSLSLLSLPSFQPLNINIPDSGLGFDLQGGEMGSMTAEMDRMAKGPAHTTADKPSASTTEAITRREKDAVSLRSKKSSGLSRIETNARLVTEAKLSQDHRDRMSPKDRTSTKSPSSASQTHSFNFEEPSAVAESDDEKGFSQLRTSPTTTIPVNSAIPSPVEHPDELSHLQQNTKVLPPLNKRPSFASATSGWSSFADHEHDETASEYATSHRRRGSLGNSDDESLAGEYAALSASALAAKEAAAAAVGSASGEGDGRRYSSSTVASRHSWYGTDTSEGGTSKRERRATMAEMRVEMRVVDWSNRALARMGSVPDDTTHLLLSLNAFSTLFFPSLPTETLQVLDLSNNSLTELPSELAQLKRLRELHLHENSFGTVPEVVGALTELEVLDLGRNKIEVLAPFLQNLKQLHHLNVAGNRLTFLPPYLSTLQNITTLILDENHTFLQPYSDLAQALITNSIPTGTLKKKGSRLLKKRNSAGSKERRKIIALAAGRATTDSDTEGRSITDGEIALSRSGSKKDKKAVATAATGAQHSRSSSTIEPTRSQSAGTRKAEISRKESREQPGRSHTFPAEKTPTEKGPEEKAAVEKVPAEKPLSEKPSAEKASAEKALAEKSPAEKSPAEKSPAEKAPAEKAPAEKAPAEKAPAEKAPAEKAPAEKTLVEKVSAEKEEFRPASDPAKKAPADNAANNSLRRSKSMNFVPPEPTAEDKKIEQESYVRMLRHERSFGSNPRIPVNNKKLPPPPITVPVPRDTRVSTTSSTNSDKQMDQDKEELTPTKKSAFGRWLQKRKTPKGQSAPATPSTSPKQTHHHGNGEEPVGVPMNRKRSNTVQSHSAVVRDSWYVSKNSSMYDGDVTSAPNGGHAPVPKQNTTMATEKEHRLRRRPSTRSWGSFDDGDSYDGIDNDLEADADETEGETKHRTENRHEVEVLNKSLSRKNSTDSVARRQHTHKHTGGADELSSYRLAARSGMSASVTSLSSDSSSISSVVIGSPPSTITTGQPPRPMSMFSTFSSSLPESYNPVTRNPSPSPSLIRLFHYLRDLYDLDPVTTQLDEVRTLQKMWNQAARTEKDGEDDTSNLEQKDKKDEDANVETAELRKANPKKRINIVKEILSTERIYVNGLQDLVDIYIAPSKDNISADERKAVFSDIQNILNFHKSHFLPALEAEVSKLDAEIEAENEGGDWKPEEGLTGVCCVGKVFNELAPYMKMYSFYINNFENALVLMRKWQSGNGKRKKSRVFLEQCKLHPKHSQLNLQGYLLLPIQRIPRYKLLLEDLQRNTSPSHPDYTPLKKATEEMVSRAAEMNERKRDHEKHERVVEIQAMVKWTQKVPLVQPHRRLIREGVLHLHHSVRRQRCFSVTSSAVYQLSEKLVDKEYVFYLFNDIMIQCRPNTGVLSESILEVVNTLELETRLEPASIRNRESTDTSAILAADAASGKNDVVLRVVDADTIYYFLGTSEDLVTWKRAINTRW